MTELEIMQHAKTYLDKLARGIDPLTDLELPENDVVNNVRISRCLFYVSDVLRQVIENGGIHAKTVKESDKTPYSLSPADRSRYPFGDWPVTVSVIAQRLNALVDLDVTQKLKVTSLTGFLVQAGLLCEETDIRGRKSKRPTEAGRRIGIQTVQRTGQNGEYTSVEYSREAQQLILDNLDAIAAINAVPLHENQGAPWSPEDDAYLRDAVRANTDVKDMSAALKRSRGAIRARIEKLGLEVQRPQP